MAGEKMRGKPVIKLTPASSLVCGECGTNMRGVRMAAGMCGHVFCSECLQRRAECPTCQTRLTLRIELIFK